MRTISRRGLVVAAVCVIAVGAAARYFAGDRFGIDPFDRFELIGIVSDPAAHHHAATYRYFHANSSATVIAVWVLSGRPPVSGSSDPVPGRPAMVWLGGPELLNIVWQDKRRKFLVEVKGRVDVRRDNAGFGDCYFADPAPPNRICLQTKQIELLVAN